MLQRYVSTIACIFIVNEMNNVINNFLGYASRFVIESILHIHFLKPLSLKKTVILRCISAFFQVNCAWNLHSSSK